MSAYKQASTEHKKNLQEAKSKLQTLKVQY
jgi:hypothetical protein